jgi:cytochrome c oxidase cbb3-type subunit III
LAAEKQEEIDAHTGTATTGHEWDGIKELNTPLPRWWLNTFYACIIWAIGYWVVYPAWPLLTGYTQGMFQWHSRAAVSDDLKELTTMRAAMNEKLAAASLAEIENTPELLSFARAEGGAAFAINCAPCHGAGGQGSKGYPNLNADRWIWGGTLAAIQTTIAHGVRWDADRETHASLMPAFGRDSMLNEPDMSDVADYVRTLSGNKPEEGADLAAGQSIFMQNCAACHGEDGKGNIELGAPNLRTQVWLYGASKAAIMERIENGGGGVMPAWVSRLDPTTIKALAVYVHSLGGGK